MKQAILCSPYIKYQSKMILPLMILLTVECKYSYQTSAPNIFKEKESFLNVEVTPENKTCDKLDETNSHQYEVFHRPHLKEKCKMKQSILDKNVIENTQNAINQCIDNYVDCNSSRNSKYRTIDGSCNNLLHPSWGKSNNCFQRILPFDYADNSSQPRESCTGGPLPNPRLISNVFHNQIVSIPSPKTTHFMAWGQMFAHDLSLNDIYKSDEFPVSCCANGPVNDEICMSIAISLDDTFYPKYEIDCVPYRRTIPCPVCKAGQRLHWNQYTGFQDLSLIYGSTEEQAEKQRSGDRGMLIIENNNKYGPMPPSKSEYGLCKSPEGRSACFLSGDLRTNQNPFILTVHIYILRHHNFICQELKKVNPHWNDEKVYQEARRINIAIVQYITYRFYIPIVLGEVAMEKEGIHVLPGTAYTTYKPDLDPSLFNEYIAVAARYGHSQIPSTMSLIDPISDESKTIFLKDYFFRPFDFLNGMFDKMVNGMTVDMIENNDAHITDDVRNNLYQRSYMNETYGVDIAATSIIRGRDHGIPGYTYYLSHILNVTVNDFNNLEEVIPVELIELLKGLYESVHDIDFYSAGLAEYHIPGGTVGPTFAFILSQQYKRLKFGDRYWFEHKNQSGSFTPDQLIEIKMSSLSRILCETSAIRKVQINPFLPASNKNLAVPCQKIHKFNFDLWKEKEEVKK